MKYIFGIPICQHLNPAEASMNGNQPQLQLTLAEAELIHSIRSGDYDRLEIKVANGTIVFLELHQRLRKPDFESVKSLLSQGRHQTMVIHQQDNHLVEIQRTQKKKF